MAAPVYEVRFIHISMNIYYLHKPVDFEIPCLRKLDKTHADANEHRNPDNRLERLATPEILTPFSVLRAQKCGRRR